MKFFLMLILFFSSLYSNERSYLSVCAIFQDEAKYLPEWLDFHEKQGVSHFYLYNNLSTDDYKEVLKPYIEKNKVTLIEWALTHETDLEWIKVQCSAYMDCVNKINNKSAWCAFLDIDEFLFSPTKLSLPLVLQEYEDCDGVGVNWVMYGSSGIFRIPIEDKITKHLVLRSKLDYENNELIKCIVQPNKIIGCENPHYFFTNNRSLVNEDKVPLVPPYRSKNSVKKLRINHYWTRDLEYFFTVKIARRLKTKMDKTFEHTLAIERKLNDVYDPILQGY